MDCNKEDALKAKQLAEKKMEIKDFYGALKIAIKAQQLYPELENISQLIVVCEVHCSAEKKSYGSDKDWYGILKIEPSADEISIKKQYKKLALILHPDKNKFSGSSDAFKLVGEAQRVLLDREKRVMYDNKRRTFGNIPNWAPKPPNRQQNAHHQHPWNVGTPVNLSGGRPGNFHFTQQQAQTGVGGKQSTFWTVCAFCSVRYQFYRDDALNKVIHCQSCKKSFTAYENAQGTTAAPSTTQTQKQPSFPRQTTYNTKPVFEKKEPPKSQVNANKKRKKRIEESSESSDSGESSESEEEEEEDHSESEGNGVPNNVNMHPDNEGEQPRRSSRSKRNVSYKENVNDIDIDIDIDEVATPSKPAEKGAEKKSKVVKEDDEKSQKNDKEHLETNSDDKANSDNIEDDKEEEEEEEEETKPEVYDCPDPEFSDFDKNRSEESFKVGQIWACYDTDDAMPRFYAYIKKVESQSPVFKLQIQWLKPDPGNDDEKIWMKKDLPVSCGYFKRGRPEKTEDILSFSHFVTWEEQKGGLKSGTIKIIPRKGETWALFKNWSMNWHSSDDDDGEERKYEYEFVEIISNYDETVGVRVSYLEKVKGFVCLFKRKMDGETVIAGSDRYRFAHMVPSYKMSGEEREGVPTGSFELDPAALPLSTFEQVN